MRFLGAERHETILKLLGPIELNNGLAQYSLFDKTFLFEYSYHNLANILKKEYCTYFFRIKMSKFEQIVFPFCFDSGLFCTVLALSCVESVEILPTNKVAITTCCAFPKLLKP